MCAAAIRMQMTDPNHNWRPFIDNSLDFITSKQHRLADSTLARNHPYENTLWLDDLYMSIPALAEAYRLTGRPQYIDDAATQVLNFAKRMFVAETGLFMHGWVESMEHNPGSIGDGPTGGQFWLYATYWMYCRAAIRSIMKY